MKNQFSRIVDSPLFNYFIVAVIIINTIFVGLEVTYTDTMIKDIQVACLVVFFIELVIRWLARESAVAFFTNKWIVFDIVVLSVSIISIWYFTEYAVLSSFRVLRIVLILRLFKAFPNFNKMVTVLVKSTVSILPTIFLFFVFMYLYSLIGIVFFKGASVITSNSGMEIDPFGSISEAFFSLFRVTTGDAWTDLRYDLMAQESITGLVNAYFISWSIIAAFLLLNIITGAIINNYDNEFEAEREIEQDEKLNFIISKLQALEKKVDNLDKR